MPNLTETVTSRPNPYVGPRSYKKGEKLYGREQETSELLDLLISERIVMLYSPSGAGKSSLLNACIVPGLESNGFRVFHSIRINHEPPPGAENDENFNRYVYSALVSMEENVAAKQRLSANELASLSLPAYIENLRQRLAQFPDEEERSLALLFDQGEEIITIDPTNRQDKQNFFNQLGQTLRDRSLWCLFSLREDYVARLDSYIKPVPTGFASRYRLRLLQAPFALACVQKPAQEHGVEFTDEAAQKLIDDLRMMRVQNSEGQAEEQPGLYVEPVQMQVVCRRLWMELDNNAEKITSQDLQDFGDVDKALGDYYAMRVAVAAAQTSVRERAIREWFDRKLITQQDIRGQVLMAPETSDSLRNEAIWALEKDYLIRAEKRGGSTWFELAHDRLIRPVRESNTVWFGQNLSLMQRAADVWNQQGRSDGLLLFGADYQQAEAWAAKNADQLLPQEVDFLNACRKYDQQQRRERRVNLIVRALLAVSLVALAVAVVMFIRANQAQNLAETRQLAADSVSSLETDPELSVLLALQAMRNTSPPEPEAVDAMHRALPAVRVLKTLRGHTDRVYAVSISRDGRLVASASRDGSVKVWDAASGSLLQDFFINPDPSPDSYGATSVAFNPEQNTLAAASALGEIILWDTDTWQEIARQLPAHDGAIWGLAFSPDGEILASGGEDNLAKTWDAASLAPLQTFQGHRKLLEAVTFSHDGLLLGSAADDRSAKVWDVQTGVLLSSFSIPNRSISQPRAMGIVFTPDDTKIIVSSTDGNLWGWDLATRAQTLRIWGHEDWVYGVTTMDGGEIISSGADRSVRIWDGTYGRPLMELRGHSDQVFGIALSPDQRWLASASADKTVRIWDVSWAGNRESFTYDTPGLSEDVDYAPDGSLIATSLTANGEDDLPAYNEPGSIGLFSPQGELIDLLQGHSMAVNSVDFSPDGASLVSTSWDKTAIVWDIASRAPRLTLQGHTAQVFSAGYSPDGKTIATGGFDGYLRIWNAQSGEALAAFDLQESLGSRRITQVQYLPQGNLLAVQVEESTLLSIFNAATGQVEMRLLGQEDTLRDFDFSPDGRWAASVGDDATLILWDLRPGIPDAARAVSKFREHFGTIYSVTYSADGKTLLTGGADGLIHVWQLEDETKQSWSILYTLRVYARGKEDTIFDLEIAPDGNHVSAVISDWTLRGFVLDEETLMTLAETRVTRSFTCDEQRRYLGQDCAEK